MQTYVTNSQTHTEWINTKVKEKRSGYAPEFRGGGADFSVNSYAPEIIYNP